MASMTKHKTKQMIRKTIQTMTALLVAFVMAGVVQAQNNVPAISNTDRLVRQLLGEDRYLVVIGVGEHVDPRVPSLATSKSDARAFYQTMTHDRLGGVLKANSWLLLDDQATKTNIRRSFEDLIHVPAEATVVVYFAGHAVEIDNMMYLVTHDTQTHDVSGTAISEAEIRRLLQSIPAYHTMVVMDTCHITALGDQRVSKTVFADQLKRFVSSNQTYLMSTHDTKQIVNVGGVDRSLFTHRVLEGVSGKSDRNFDGVVTMPELTSWVSRDVVSEFELKDGVVGPVVRSVGVPVADRFFVAVDLTRIENNRREQIDHRRYLRSIWTMYSQGKLYWKHYHLGNRLLRTPTYRLNARTRREREMIIAVARGEFDPRQLDSELRRLARIPLSQLERADAQEQATETAIQSIDSQPVQLDPIETRQAMNISSQIDKLVATARANDSVRDGGIALIALAELLRLDPNHTEALALQKQIQGYYGRQDTIASKDDMVISRSDGGSIPSDESASGGDPASNTGPTSGGGSFGGLLPMERPVGESSEPSLVPQPNQPTGPATGEPSLDALRTLGKGNPGSAFPAPSDINSSARPATDEGRAGGIQGLLLPPVTSPPAPAESGGTGSILDAIRTSPLDRQGTVPPPTANPSASSPPTGLDILSGQGKPLPTLPDPNAATYPPTPSRSEMIPIPNGQPLAPPAASGSEPPLGPLAGGGPSSQNVPPSALMPGRGNDLPPGFGPPPASPNVPSALMPRTSNQFDPPTASTAGPIRGTRPDSPTTIGGSEPSGGMDPKLRRLHEARRMNELRNRNATLNGGLPVSEPPRVPTTRPAAAQPSRLEKPPTPTWVTGPSLNEPPTSAATAARPAGSVDPASESRKFTNSAGMVLVPISAGDFVMGSPETEEGRYDEEEQQHRVTISRRFFMTATEITQTQWTKIMGRNPSFPQGDDLPVNKIKWHEAVEFCRKLSEMEHRRYRLPTEAEWEYACRAGTVTPYYFGSSATDLKDFAWFAANSEETVHPVATKEPNKWGLYDMIGNVSEWCADWRGDYPTEPVVDPIGTQNGTSRILRGGSWDSEPVICRSAARFAESPDFAYMDMGFRVVLEAAE